MTSNDLRAVIDTALGTVPFTPPVSVVFCSEVYKAIKVAAPAETIVDVYHRLTELVVETRCGAAHHRLVVPL